MYALATVMALQRGGARTKKKRTATVSDLFCNNKKRALSLDKMKIILFFVFYF